MDFAKLVTDSIPDDQKYGMDPVMVYDIIVLACKGIVACSDLPLMSSVKAYSQANYSSSTNSFDASATIPTAVQILKAARQKGVRLPLFQCHQWAHQMLLQSLNAPEAVLTSCLDECSKG